MQPPPVPAVCGHRTCRFVARVSRLGRGDASAAPCRRSAPQAAGVVSLDQLRRGQPGRVLHVGGRPAVRRRLLELGITRGETIRLERTAPLGDPLEFVVKGYHLSLRAREAAAITVEALDS